MKTVNYLLSPSSIFLVNQEIFLEGHYGRSVVSSGATLFFNSINISEMQWKAIFLFHLVA
jgi:hypothetical protein